MPTLKTVERRIQQIEGFAVRFLYLNGANIRSDKEQIPAYPFERAAKNANKVAAWRDQRFKQTYPGFKCDVLDFEKKVCHGRTLLSTVRDSYLE